MNEQTKTTSIGFVSVIYALLVSLTLVTWFMGQSGLQGLSLSMLVLAIALFKAQLVGDYFMQLKPLRGIWRWVVSLWLLIPGSLIAVAFYLS